MAPWKLPVIVAALVVPIVAAFAVGGPAFGVAVGAFAVLVLLVVAARQRPRGPIGSPARNGRRVLLVAMCAVEEPAAVERIAAATGLGAGIDRAELLVLSPVSIGFLDRWASDVEGARHAAQERLVVTVAALAKAGIDADARVGDEDVVQAVEDQLRSYPADEVVLVSAGGDGEGRIERAAAELESRLRADFAHLRFGD